MTTEAERNGELTPDSAAVPPDDEQELQQEAHTDLSMLSEAARFATPERAHAVVHQLVGAIGDLFADSRDKPP